MAEEGIAKIDTANAKLAELGLPSGVSSDRQNSKEGVKDDTAAKQTSSNDLVRVPADSNNKKFGETPYRWYVMIAYSLCVFANGFQWVTFSAVSTDFADAYNMDMWKVNMFSLIYMIIYPFVCIPQGWMVDSYSCRWAIVIAAICTLIAAAFKLLVNKSMACCFIGQFFAGLFQPALLNSPGKIAANWFREDIRTVICTICCLADTVGIFVGFLWNLGFIDENKSGEDYKDEFFKYILSEFILCAVFCLPAFFIFKEKPDIPPSPSQNTEEENRPGTVESLKLLFTNKRFIYLLISTLFVVGYYDVMGTIINSLLDMYQITTAQSSIIYAVSSIVGMLASLGFSYLVDKTQKFKIILVSLCIAGVVFQVLFTVFLELSTIYEDQVNVYAVGLVLYSLVNAVVVPFYTIGMNYACEITYPAGESVNGGLMMTMSQISGIAGTFLCQHFIDNFDMQPWISNVILICFFVIAVVFVLLFDEKLDRHEIDAGGKEKDKEENSDKNDGKPELIEPQKVEIKSNE